jgi:hypothetical protein
VDERRQRGDQVGAGCRAAASPPMPSAFNCTRSPTLGNFMRTLAMPKTVELWSLTTLREMPIKISAKVVSHGRYVTFQMAEIAMSPQMFAEIPSLIARLRAPPAPA